MASKSYWRVAMAAIGSVANGYYQQQRLAAYQYVT